MSKLTKRTRAATALRVRVTDGRGRRIAARGLGAWLARVAPARARGTVTIALVSDREIQRLNREFRGKNTPTDVLSFPVGRPFQGRRGDVRPAGRDLLGEIAIARGLARRQARDRGHSGAVEWRVLALHGLLHLLGYDHETDDGRMQRVERRLRRKGGLREGLIDRVQT